MYVPKLQKHSHSNKLNSGGSATALSFYFVIFFIKLKATIRCHESLISDWLAYTIFGPLFAILSHFFLAELGVILGAENCQNDLK